MLIVDRVFCDSCLCLMGQLHSLSPEEQERISDFRTAPDYCLCPDCSPVSVDAVEQQGRDSTEG
ncbi:hypothetical protein [Pseudomonas sp. 5P_3.1_Bac2]|uniref:hypothetical protein n=1 Tax=Pseudomonas sp. 5P_3.1_Bac2 TaxID=2971617 RepID=UPI0021C6F50F|nr:hypothetical protein [Pseudomonas sp. 5P_3.1_Bac2]MCU1717694.1 hypothetical protein [Pseudomonas sp. 5P_3.1_Bac2]